MVNFRRVITALAVLALFTGLASAQVGGTGQTQLTCNTNVTVTPALRGEGFTEQTGDITISCTGGAYLAPTSQIPLVNITVFYNTTVTSRLLPISGTSTIQGSSNTSEALLLIDEPGSGLPGYGPSLGQKLCTTPLTGCAAFVDGTAGATFNTAVTSAGVYAPNVYQGVVNGNSVTFFGVPVLPPTTTGSRVYRVTNVRVNAQPLAGGSASGASPVQASISISGATSLSISNSAPNVGYVSNGLTASAGSSTQNQCSTQTKTAISILTFSENFGTAFKTRVNATLASQNTLYAGQRSDPSPAQNVPGSIYNSESNFIYPISGTQIAGLADFGTRLKATFNNIPAGARIFVSTANVNNGASPWTAPAIIGGSAGNATPATGAYTGYAQLVNGESTSDGNAGVSGFFPAVTATDNGPNGGNVPIAEVSLAAGTGSAVWEVVNSNANTNESLKFAVYVTYTANVAQNAPLPGVSTVNLSYAPTATSGVASSTLAIPRFAGDSSAARTLLTIQICRTILLYPYITNQAGFDTGLTIANTSLDSYTTGSNATGAQSGSCKLTFYGGTTAAPLVPSPAVDTPTIAGGTVWVNTLQAIAPNFQGYMFAVCNFQFAHGFAFISDVGARNLAMGYLAVVLNDPGTGARGNANTTTSENGGR
ncbi:MAG: hypothetical protein NTW28_13135 [Candidatus Solibacter sp.]|nr:hypothetical protein [Candidatus Solibacter sp.]